MEKAVICYRGRVLEAWEHEDRLDGPARRA